MMLMGRPVDSGQRFFHLYESADFTQFCPLYQGSVIVWVMAFMAGNRGLLFFAVVAVSVLTVLSVDSCYFDTRPPTPSLAWAT